jgi:hypothetical protein
MHGAQYPSSGHLRVGSWQIGQQCISDSWHASASAQCLRGAQVVSTHKTAWCCSQDSAYA